MEQPAATSRLAPAQSGNVECRGPWLAMSRSGSADRIEVCQRTYKPARATHSSLSTTPSQDKSQRNTRSDDSTFAGLATRIGPADDNHPSLGRNYIEPLARDFATSAHHTGVVGTALLVGSLYAAGDFASRRGSDGAPAHDHAATTRRPSFAPCRPGRVPARHSRTPAPAGLRAPHCPSAGRTGCVAI